MSRAEGFRWAGAGPSHRSPFEDDVQRVDNAGNVSETCEENVEAERACAADLEEDAQRREEDCEEDLADIASSERHLGRL